MTSTNHFAVIFERFKALDAALHETRGTARPEYVRRLTALALLGVDGAPDTLAARTSSVAADLRGAPGVPGTARLVFAAGLVSSGKAASDYWSAREGLLPALRHGGLRPGLPAAALVYAAAGRTDIDGAHRARIAALASHVRAPWWSTASAANGYFAAALALIDERPDVIEQRLIAARRALYDAGAPEHIARDGGRQLALSGAEPIAAARTWSTLYAARGSGRWRGVKPEMLVEVASAAGARADEAAATLAASHDAVRSLRPGVSGLARPYLVTSLAAHALAPRGAPSQGAISALQAVQAAIAAANAATAATVAATAAVVASG